MSNTKSPRLTNLFGLIAILHKNFTLRREMKVSVANASDIWMTVMYIRATMHRYWGDVDYGWPLHMALFTKLWEYYFTAGDYTVEYATSTEPYDEDELLLNLTRSYSAAFNENKTEECSEVISQLINFYSSPGCDIVIITDLNKEEDV